MFAFSSKSMNGKQIFVQSLYLRQNAYLIVRPGLMPVEHANRCMRVHPRRGFLHLSLIQTQPQPAHVLESHIWNAFMYVSPMQ